MIPDKNQLKGRSYLVLRLEGMQSIASGRPEK